jgi:hypothetical protein
MRVGILGSGLMGGKLGTIFARRQSYDPLVVLLTAPWVRVL